MKKTDYIILAVVAAYTYLFYQELPGINFMVFNLVVIAAMIIRDHTVLAKQRWLVAAMASLSSGVCVLLYGNTLSAIANGVSLAVMGGFAFRGHASLIISLLNSVYSILSWPAFVVINKFFAPQPQDDKTPEMTVSPGTAQLPEGYRRLALYVFPLAVSLLFFFIYREANPHFKSLTDQIDWGYISWPLLRFILIGAVIISGYFYHRSIKELDRADDEASSSLHEDQLKPREKGIISSRLTLDTEIKSGTVLFILLNLMLLVVNVLDVQFLWLPGGVGEGLSHSQAVHQSVGNLILSIVLAIVLILFYFRGHVNFTAQNGWIRAMAYVWIVQNVFLVASTGFRNLEYVELHSLTYKRIGVFVYLLLTLSGLLTTFIKVWLHKSNWYLFRVNGWSFFMVLIVSCYFNWDVLITRYNIMQTKEVDYYYLSGLSYANLPELLEHIPEEELLNYKYRIDRKIEQFIKDDKTLGWPSWSIQRRRVKDYLLEHGYMSLPTQNMSYE